MIPQRPIGVKSILHRTSFSYYTWHALAISRRFASMSAASAGPLGAPSPSPPSYSSLSSTNNLLFNTTLFQGNTPHEWRDNVLQVRTRPLLTRLYSFGMPKGFPLSCAPGYSRFFYLYIAHSFISNFSMSIATQALLGGFFAESTPQIWMIKDLVPSLVAAYLANKVASYELRPKYWMLISVLLSQGASIVDLIIPMVVGPKYLLAAAIATAVVKHNATLMHFVARASILQHFAIYQNLGEIQKKLNSFGMINYTIATALGIAYTSLFPTFTAHALAVGVSSIVAVTLIHFSLSHVAFRGLSPITGQLVLQKYLSSDFARVATLSEARDILGTTATLPSSACMKAVFAVNPPLSSLVVSKDDGIKQTLLSGNGIEFSIGMWHVKDTFSPLRFWKKKTVASRPRLVLFIHRKCPPMQLFLAHLLCYAALDKAEKSSGGACSLEKWEQTVREFFCQSLVNSLQKTSLTAALEDAVLELEIAAVFGKMATGADKSLNSHKEPINTPPQSSEDDLPLPPPPLPPKKVDPRSWTHGNEADGMLWLRRTAMLTELLKHEGWDVATPSLDPIERRISTKPESLE